MITAAGSEPGPGSTGPGAVIRTRCADRGGGGQGGHRTGRGDGGPDARSGPAEQPARLRSKFRGAAVMLWSGSLMLHVSHRPALEVRPPVLPSDRPYGAG
jgi:hypothetical protein